MDFQELVYRLWRRRWVVATTLALGSLFGLLFATSQTPVYAAQASLLIGPRSTNQQDLSQALDELAFSRELLRSYLLVFEGRSMAERLVERLQLPVSPTKLQGQIDAKLLPDTRVIEIAVTNTDPGQAAAIANEVVDVFRVEFQPAIGGGTVSATPITVASTPSSPVAPRPMRTGILGLFLAGFGVIAATLLRDRLDVTIRSPEDLGALPVLAVIPDLRTKRAWLKLGAAANEGPASSTAEAFRMLRAAIEFRLPEGSAVILTTSPRMGDGKTTVAMSLARTYMRAGRKVAMVDMDLRRPALHTRLGLPLAPGVADAVSGTPFHHEVDGMRVMIAGATIDQSTENPLIEKLESIATKLREDVDIAIIDTPPVNVVDPLLIARHVQGVVLVARAGRSTKREVERAIQRITESGGELLGIVLNGMRHHDAGYGYGYGYGYGGYGYGGYGGYGDAEPENAPARALPGDER